MTAQDFLTGLGIHPSSQKAVCFMNDNDEEFELAQLLEMFAKKQREKCVEAYRGVGKARFTRYGSKKVESAILNAQL